MNILEEIQNCPVEWKELGEVCEIETGKLNANESVEDGKYPFFTTAKEISRINSFRWNTEALLIAGNANVGDVKYYSGKFEAYQRTYVLTNFSHNVKARFLLHIIKQGLKSYLENNTNKAAMSYIVISTLKSFPIPIPPIEIQEKIVQILDKFTDYVTELTSELTSRKKQYSFYRDKLLSFEDEVYQVEWKILEEVAKFNYGYTDKAKDTGDVRFIRITDIDENGYLKSNDKKYIALSEESRNYLVKYGDLLMARTGATYGKTLFIDTDEASAYASFLIKITPSEELNSRYYWHFSKSELYWKQANNLVSKAGQPQFNANSLKNIKIPVPSLEIQSRIVQVLDNFDMVCNDLNIGLPKEIELRQKQYEYFREKLLTFVAEGEYTESRVEEWDNSAIIKLLQWVFGPIRVELGAICDFVRGNGLQKKDFTAIGKSVIHYGQIYTKYDFSVSETLSKTSEIVFEKLKKAQPNDLVMATTSENVEDVGKAIVWEGKEEIGISGDSYIIQTTQNSRYLNYWLRSTSFQTQKERKVTGTKVIRINSKDIEKFQIILPSLIEQERIVSILDKFNILTHSLSEGLPKEIKLRQKQYEYWREQLLDFDL